MLKLSEGFTKLFPSLGLVIGMGLAFYFLTMCLKTIPLSTAYAIWAGVGTALTALLGMMLWNDPFSLWSGIGLVMVIGGVILLNLSKSTGKSSQGPSSMTNNTIHETRGGYYDESFKTSRNSIFCSTIIENSGMDKLTLEAVAKNAGVSKGGLLHHFLNKEAIIKGMLDEIGDAFLSEMKQKVRESGDDIGKWSRAYVQITFNNTETTTALSSALLEVLFSNSELLSDYHQKNTLIEEEMSKDGIDPVDAAIVKLATDGLWFAELLGFGNIKEEVRDEVEKRLINMTYNNKQD